MYSQTDGCMGVVNSLYKIFVIDIIKSIDSEVCLDGITKACMKNYEGIQKFFDHCCQVRHYSFCIKKCGQNDCDICKPIRLPREVFDQISFLPDPVPQDDGHYKKFKDVFGTETTEDHRPSLQKRHYREKSVPFPVSVQHARNTNMVVQCEECNVAHCVFKVQIDRFGIRIIEHFG